MRTNLFLALLAPVLLHAAGGTQPPATLRLSVIDGGRLKVDDPAGSTSRKKIQHDLAGFSKLKKAPGFYE